MAKPVLVDTGHAVVRVSSNEHYIHITVMTPTSCDDGVHVPAASAAVSLDREQIQALIQAFKHHHTGAY